MSIVPAAIHSQQGLHINPKHTQTHTRTSAVKYYARHNDSPEISMVLVASLVQR